MSALEIQLGKKVEYTDSSGPSAAQWFRKVIHSSTADEEGSTC